MENKLQVNESTKKVEFIDRETQNLIVGEYPHGMGEFNANDLNEEQERGYVTIVKVEN